MTDRLSLLRIARSAVTEMPDYQHSTAAMTRLNEIDTEIASVVPPDWVDDDAALEALPDDVLVALRRRGIGRLRDHARLETEARRRSLIF